MVSVVIVLASFDNNPAQAVNSIGGGVIFVAIAMLVVRPILSRCQRWFLNEQGQLSEGGVTIGLCLMALAAWFTDLIHLHAVLARSSSVQRFLKARSAKV